MYLKSVLLYTYNLNSEENDVGPDSRQHCQDAYLKFMVRPRPRLIMVTTTGGAVRKGAVLVGGLRRRRGARVGQERTAGLRVLWRKGNEG